MSQPLPQQPAAASDPVTEVAAALLKAAAGVVVVLVALPLVVPLLVLAVLPPGAATKTRYWTSPQGWTAAVIAGPLAGAALLIVEAALLTSWLQERADTVFAQPMPVWLGEVWQVAAPWLLANLLVGVLLVPAGYGWRRRQVAKLVQDRRIPDVVTQERIETARKHAADHTAARAIGVRLDSRTGAVRRIDPAARCAPALIDGVPTFGVVARPTVRTVAERLHDRRQVRDWVSRDSRWMQIPDTAGAVRALLVAESGSGKTVLLTGLIESALTRGWPVVFIDAKGDPADATALVTRARAAGHTAATAGRWNLFTGGSAQIVEKLMRLLPAPDGANQHYLDEARAVLAAIQGGSPLTSVTDLHARLADPTAHVRDTADRDLVTAVVEARSGLTAATRVQRALSAALRPLEELLDPAGWSYRALGQNLTVVSLSPADSAHARLGDLMLVDLRHTLATRLATGDKSPLLAVVDEFAQLVGSDSDPGDTAAALFETARSAGCGLVLAAQSTAGISGDDTRRARALASGAALILGRSKDPEDVVRYAGTVMRMEASGAAAGEELRSARAQHTWVIPPQDVREAWDGAFWLIQAGAIAAFRALPPAPAVMPVADAAHARTHDAFPDTADATTAPVEALREPVLREAVAGPAQPTPRVQRPSGARRRDPAPVETVPDRVAGSVLTWEVGVTGLEIEVVHHGAGSWLATAWPATDDTVLNDVPDPDCVPFLTDRHPTGADSGVWHAQWHPAFTPAWADDPAMTEAWRKALERLIARARAHWQL